MRKDRVCGSEASSDLETQMFLVGYRDVVMGTNHFPHLANTTHDFAIIHVTLGRPDW
jgi:hypothetical protein